MKKIQSFLIMLIVISSSLIPAWATNSKVPLRIIMADNNNDLQYKETVAVLITENIFENGELIIPANSKGYLSIVNVETGRRRELKSITLGSGAVADSSGRVRKLIISETIRSKSNNGLKKAGTIIGIGGAALLLPMGALLVSSIDEAGMAYALTAPLGGLMLASGAGLGALGLTSMRANSNSSLSVSRKTFYASLDQ